MFCMKCGNKSPDSAAFCRSCGAKLIAQSQSVCVPQPVTDFSDDLKSSIHKVFTQASGIETLYLFENIPSKKLTNAVSSYAASIGKNETIIMLYDDTVFGSGKAGFLLTSRGLYCKFSLGKAEFAGISEINTIRIVSTKPAKLSVEMKDSSINIFGNMIRPEKVDAFCNVLYETIELLGGKMSPVPKSVENTPENQEPRCTICGNQPPKDAGFCNRCGASITEQDEGLQSVFCHKCGSKENEGSEFCRKCGEKLIVALDYYDYDYEFEEDTNVLDTIGSIVDIAGGIRDIFR